MDKADALNDTLDSCASYAALYVSFCPFLFPFISVYTLYGRPLSVNRIEYGLDEKKPTKAHGEKRGMRHHQQSQMSMKNVIACPFLQWRRIWNDDENDN